MSSAKTPGVTIASCSSHGAISTMSIGENTGKEEALSSP